jgi:hypothetical protein
VWQHLSAGGGTKATRLHDWACRDRADRDAAEYGDKCTGLWTRGPLIRRNIGDGVLAFFSTGCPAGTGMAALVTVEGHRQAIEDSFETAKNELGLDHNETRSWHGWHRHVSLAMLAFATMAAPKCGTMRARISMDGRGRWMDNVSIERPWRSLKYGCVCVRAFETSSELRVGLAGWIGYYNVRRPHSTLAGRSRTSHAGREFRAARPLGGVEYFSFPWLYA